MIDDLAHEREVVVRDRKLDIRVLVWTLIVSFAVGRGRDAFFIPFFEGFVVGKGVSDRRR